MAYALSMTTSPPLANTMTSHVQGRSPYWYGPDTFHQYDKLHHSVNVTLEDTNLTYDDAQALHVNYKYTWFMSDQRYLAIAIVDQDIQKLLSRLLSPSGRARKNVFLLTDLLEVTRNVQSLTKLREISWYYGFLYLSFIWRSQDLEALNHFEYARWRFLQQLEVSVADPTYSGIIFQNDTAATLRDFFVINSSQALAIIQYNSDHSTSPHIIHSMTDLDAHRIEFRHSITGQMPLRTGAERREIASGMSMMKSALGSRWVHAVLRNETIRIWLPGYILNSFEYMGLLYVYIDAPQFTYHDTGSLPWGNGLINSYEILCVDELIAFTHESAWDAHKLAEGLKTQVKFLQDSTECLEERNEAEHEHNIDEATQNDALKISGKDDTDFEGKDDTDFEGKDDTDFEDNDDSVEIDPDLCHALHTRCQLDLILSKPVSDPSMINRIIPDSTGVLVYFKASTRAVHMSWKQVYDLCNSDQGNVVESASTQIRDYLVVKPNYGVLSKEV